MILISVGGVIQSLKSRISRIIEIYFGTPFRKYGNVSYPSGYAIQSRDGHGSSHQLWSPWENRSVTVAALNRAPRFRRRVLV